MDLKDRIQLGYGIVKARLFNKRIPLLIGWSLTNRCSLRCRYCDIRNLKSFEMPTKAIKAIIDELAAMGNKCIQFTGGDPILRDDIGEILDYCYYKKIYTTLSCTGTHVPDKIGELKKLGRMGLSLDGSPKVNDYLRGEGSFEKMIQAAECLKKAGIKFKFVMVITNYNYSEIDFLLDLADKYNSSVLFQPGTIKKLYNIEENNETVAQIDNYRKTIEKIIKLKCKGGRISNSITALRHLKSWPEPTRIFCPGGRIFACIRNDGQVAVCSRVNDKDFERNNCLEKGFKNAFQDLPHYRCDNCWAALHVECGSLLAFKSEAMLNAFKLI